MMLYLTGSEISLLDSANAPQQDPFNSIGGNVSSTPVPNGEVNSLFDIVSSYSLEKKNSETIGLALLNKFNFSVTNIRIKTIVKKDRLCCFKIGAVGIGESMSMELLPNRYAEPIGCEFYNSDFESPSVDVKILSPATSGEEIAILPLNIIFTVEEGGWEGTFEALEQAFSNNEDYYMDKVSKDVFRIYSKAENQLPSPINVSFVSTDNFRCDVNGVLENKEPMNELILIENGVEFKPNEAIGIWLKRDFINKKRPTNEELVKMYLEEYTPQLNERVELLITYDKFQQNEQ